MCFSSSECHVNILQSSITCRVITYTYQSLLLASNMDGIAHFLFQNNSGLTDNEDFFFVNKQIIYMVPVEIRFI